MDQQPGDSALPAISRHTGRMVRLGQTPEMTMPKSLFLITAIAVAAGVAAAQASSLGRPCTAATQTQWLPLEALQAKVEALGYTVQKAKLKNACGELYATDKNGSRVELFVDPTNGEIVGRL
jgi:hypothetical protein